MKTSENIALLSEQIYFILHYMSCLDNKDSKLVYTAFHKRFKKRRTNSKDLFQRLLFHIEVFMFNSGT